MNTYERFTFESILIVDHCFLQAWLAEINEYASEDVVIMLLGNKCDVTNERTVRTEDGARLAKVRNTRNIGV